MLVFLLALVLLFACKREPSIDAKQDGRPNAILISLDTVRADRMGAFGGADNSPRIDQLASRSTVFKDTLAVSPWTLPSHASIFTGLYPSNHGARCKYAAFDKSARSIAEILSSKGYDTVSFNGGGNVRGDLGFERGFDEYKSFRFGFGLNDKLRYIRSDPTLPLKAGVKWLDERGASKASDKPFFLFLHTFEAHAPYYSRRDDSFTDYSTVMRLQRDPVFAVRDNALRDYDGGIHWADKYVGEVVRALKKYQFEKSTIVILTSDHGEGFLEHGLVNHSIKLYPEFVRVPLLIFDPLNPVGKVSDSPASLVDIKPTLMAMLGIALEPGLDGISLLNPVDDSRARYAEVCFDPGWAGRLIRSGLISSKEVSSTLIAKGDWRLIFNDLKGTFELYDAKADPLSQNNLIETKAAETASLKGLLNTWIASTKARKTGRARPAEPQKKPPVQGLTPSQVEQMKSLGYIESQNEQQKPE